MHRVLISLVLLLGSGYCVAQDVPNLVALGNQAMNDGAYREAQSYYQQALQRDPQNWDIYTMLGFSMHKQKYYKKADSLYRIVLDHDTTGSKIYWYKALNHVSLKEDSIAIDLYKRFIRHEMNKGGSLTYAYRSIGQSYERLLYKTGLFSWQIDDMIYHYEQVEKADPSAPEVPLITNFIEKVKRMRPSDQVGKWKMVP